MTELGEVWRLNRTDAFWTHLPGGSMTELVYYAGSYHFSTDVEVALMRTWYALVDGADGLV